MRRLWTATTAAGLLLGSFLPVKAQEEGALALHHGPGAVHLRWSSPAEPPAGGFHVWRRAERGTWRRLTGEPLRRVEDVEAIRSILGPAAEAYLQLFPEGPRVSEADYRAVMQDPVLRRLLRLHSVRHPAAALVAGERYADADLEEGTAFLYRITLGEETPWAETARPVRHGAVEAVPVPRGLRGEGGDAVARLAWDHDPALSRSGALVGYRVERARRPYGPFEVLTPETLIPTRVGEDLPEHLYVDRFLENGTAYHYRLTGVNVFGLTSEPTAPIEVTPRDLSPPPAPEGLEGHRVGSVVRLRWAPAVAPDLAGYRVYRSDAPAGPYEAITGPPHHLAPGPLHVDDAVEAGRDYWYRVSSVDREGNESAPSETVQVFLADATPPSAPRGVRAEAGPEGIRITWEANEEADLRGYLVERTARVEVAEEGPRAEGDFYALHAGALEETSTLDPVPAESQSWYAYRVVAVDEAWNRSAPSEVVTARMTDRVPPRPPALHSVRLEGAKVVLRWAPSTEEDVSGYAVYRADDKDAPFVRRHEEPLSRSTDVFEDVPEASDRVYRYRMTALDAAGNESEPTPVARVHVVDRLPPEPPTDLRLQVGEDGSHRLTWRPSPSPDVARLLVYRRDGGEGPYRLRGEAGPDAEAWTTRRVPAAGTVASTYVIRAVDGAGNVGEASEPSVEGEPAPVRPPTPPPTPPAPSPPRPERGAAEARPFPWTWILLGGVVLLVVVGALLRRRR